MNQVEVLVVAAVLGVIQAGLAVLLTLVVAVGLVLVVVMVVKHL